MRTFTRIILSAVIFFGAFYASCVFAAPISFEVPRQTVSVTIGSDFIAQGKWTLPINTNTDGDNYWFKEFKNFGSRGTLSYKLTGIANDAKNLSMHQEGNDWMSILTGYPSGVGIKKLFVDYKVTPLITKPLALYEFWVADGGYFFSPGLTINYPKDWKVVSVWPKAASVNPISIEYPTDTSYARPVLVLFSTPSSGALVKEVGRFTIAADSIEFLSKLEQVVSKLTFLDELYKTTLGLPVPSHITVIAHDLVGANVGYEAEALAARPDVVILNEEFLRKRSIAELESILVHEIVHITELEQNLFFGATFIAPWLHEGLAVFVENYAQSLIFQDEESRVRQNLVGFGHLFSAKQLKQKYTKNFDFLFDGSGYYSVTAAYKHAGVVMRNFFDRAGVKGMVSLFAKLKSASSSQLCASCDSDKIVEIMKSIVGETDDNKILFPFRGEPDFESKVAKLTYPEYSQSVAEKVFQSHLKSINSYFPLANKVTPPSVTVATTSASTVASSTAAVPKSVPKPVVKPLPKPVSKPVSKSPVKSVSKPLPKLVPKPLVSPATTTPVKKAPVPAPALKNKSVPVATSTKQSTIKPTKVSTTTTATKSFVR